MLTDHRRSSRSLVAYHEAAHLVVAVYNGIALHGVVTIESNQDSQAHTGMLRIPPWKVEREEGFVRLVTTYLAGGAVERQLADGRERETDALNAYGDVSDRLLAVETLSKAYPNDDAAYDRIFARSKRRAREQVRRLGKQIDIVAQALQRHRAIDAQAVRDHLYSHLSRRELERLSRRTGETLSWLLTLHEKPVPLRRAVVGE